MSDQEPDNARLARMIEVLAPVYLRLEPISGMCAHATYPCNPEDLTDCSCYCEVVQLAEAAVEYMESEAG